MSIPEDLALTSPTSGSCSVDVVRSWTQTTDLQELIEMCSSSLTLLHAYTLVVGHCSSNSLPNTVGNIPDPHL
jgi:hypothetical protein